MKGKYTRKHTKSLALVLALVLVIGCVAGVLISNCSRESLLTCGERRMV